MNQQTIDEQKTSSLVSQRLRKACEAALARLENPLLDTSLFDDIKLQLREALGKEPTP